jgi:hypothetical protein
MPAAEQAPEEWRAHLEHRLSNATGPLTLGILLLELSESMPGRLGEFHRQFPSMTVPTLAGGRFRDILPLPLPASPCLLKWKELASWKKTHRQARARLANSAAIEVWTRLCILGLNFQHCGRNSPALWKHSQAASAAQISSLQLIREACSYFVEGLPREVPIPYWRLQVGESRMDYNLVECFASSCLASPIRESPAP